MATNAERQRAYRERMKASGLARVAVWCTPETAKTLGKMKPGEVDGLVSGNGQAFPGNALEAVKAAVADWRAKVDEAAAKAAEKGQQAPGQSSRWANAVAMLKDLERALGGHDDGCPDAAASPKQEPPAPVVLDYPAFAGDVRGAAERCRSGRFGPHKVFVSHVWRQLVSESKHRGLDLAAFKGHLLEAMRRRLLHLSRADLGYALDPADVADSSIAHLNDTLHFIRLD